MDFLGHALGISIYFTTLIMFPPTDSLPQIWGGRGEMRIIPI